MELMKGNNVVFIISFALFAIININFKIIISLKCIY